MFHSGQTVLAGNEARKEFQISKSDAIIVSIHLKANILGISI